MAQKAVRSEASSPNSLSPERDWPEVRGEECRPRTVLSWLLAKWVVGESKEAGRRTLSSHGPENPEKKEIALSLRRWVNKMHYNYNYYDNVYKTMAQNSESTLILLIFTFCLEIAKIEVATLIVA